jgi:uncharacterized membrane protein
MKKSGISAVGFRSLLIVLIILSIGLAVVGFYFAQNALVEYSKVVGQTVADSTNTGKDVQSLKTLQAELAAKQDVIIKSASLLATTANYQSQAINDINAYATESGLNVSSYSFALAPTTAVAGAPSSSNITVSLTSPMPYLSLLKFVRLVETNIPKMQIASINLTRQEGDSTMVKTDQISIDVYTN